MKKGSKMKITRNDTLIDRANKMLWQGVIAKTEIARDLGVSVETIQNWLNKRLLPNSREEGLKAVLDKYEKDYSRDVFLAKRREELEKKMDSLIETVRKQSEKIDALEQRQTVIHEAQSNIQDRIESYNNLGTLKKLGARI